MNGESILDPQGGGPDESLDHGGHARQLGVRVDPLRAFNSNGTATPQFHAAERFETRQYFACLLALTLAGGAGAAGRLGTVPMWQFAGGLLGAFYVWAMAASVSALGVVTALAALVLGQLGAALLIDHFGVFGVAVQPVSPRRLVAVVLVGAGLVLSRL